MYVWDVPGVCSWSRRLPLTSSQIKLLERWSQSRDVGLLGEVLSYFPHRGVSFAMQL
jgi:hypothetical protein